MGLKGFEAKLESFSTIGEVLAELQAADKDSPLGKYKQYILEKLNVLPKAGKYEEIVIDFYKEHAAPNVGLRYDVHIFGLVGLVGLLSVAGIVAFLAVYSQ